jgi:hypothetical protein
MLPQRLLDCLADHLRGNEVVRVLAHPDDLPAMRMSIAERVEGGRRHEG